MNMTTDSFQELTVPINLVLAEQLDSLPDLGTDIAEGGFYARVADHPIGRSVRSLLRELGQPDPVEIGIYRRFELWCIPHRLAIMRRSGAAEPTSVGIEVEYCNESSTCSIVSLFPAFEYVEHGRMSGSVSFRGAMSPTGEIAPEVTGAQAATAGSVALGTLKAAVSASGEITLNLESSVSTPVVAAVGVGARSCEWRFEKRKEPLFGRDIETWAVVALPKRQRELRYRARFYMTTRTLFVPTRRESDWVDITCRLEP